MRYLYFEMILLVINLILFLRDHPETQDFQESTDHEDLQ